MVVLSYRTIKEFVEEHSDVEDALNNWYTIAEKADWANFHEIKKYSIRLTQLVMISMSLTLEVIIIG